LPRLTDTQTGSAEDINDLGEIVGTADVGKVLPHRSYTPDWHACLWKNGQVIDLTTQIGGRSG
jgi:probable HAF family extracellular repeat protein